MQKQVCKILVIVFSAIASVSFAASTSKVLTTADSLFSKKQYTQALELYNTLYKESRYSPAMLLRMAYIHEGLGHLGESLYYLNLYYISSDDAQALRKMEEMAEKNNLEGYKSDAYSPAFQFLQKYYSPIAMAIAAFCILMLALVFVLRNKRKTDLSLAISGLIIGLGFLFAHINFSTKDERGIVAGAPTYLMSGPSAGSSVVAIIGEGHQLEITGKKDVWLRVVFREREVYVRDFLVREISL